MTTRRQTILVAMASALGACTYDTRLAAPLDDGGASRGEVASFTPYAPAGTGAGGGSSIGGASGSAMLGQSGRAGSAASMTGTTEGGFVLYDLHFRPTAMSPDGRVVAGNEPGSTLADIWQAGTPATVLVIGDLEVAGVGDQGSIVVGTQRGLPGCLETNGAAAARWSGGFQDLGMLSGGDEWSVATGVSADGKVVVGTSGAGTSCAHEAGGPVVSEQGFWTLGQSVDAVGPVPGDSRSRALAVSTSGTTVLGLSLVDGSGAGRLFVQSVIAGVLAVTPTRPPVLLLDEPDQRQVDAGVIGAYVSADGSVVAGTLVDDAQSSTPLAWHAFRWTRAGGLAMLAPTPDASNAAVVGLSADGATVIGYESSAIPDLFSGRAVGVRWTAAGVELVSKEPTSPYIVNADATTIVGGNVTPTVWRGESAGLPGVPLFADAPLFAARCASPIVTAISDDGLTFAGSCATGPAGFVAQSLSR